jgi:hypothetical protein
MKRKQVRPVMRWPWCDVCAAHVREVDDVRHLCVLPMRMFVQLEFTWGTACR